MSPKGGQVWERRRGLLDDGYCLVRILLQQSVFCEELDYNLDALRRG